MIGGLVSDCHVVGRCFPKIRYTLQSGRGGSKKVRIFGKVVFFSTEGMGSSTVLRRVKFMVINFTKVPEG